MAKAARVIVKAKDSRDQSDKLIRIFTKKVKKDGLIELARENRYYKKPSIKKREKRERAERMRRREERKRSKAIERKSNRSG